MNCTTILAIDMGRFKGLHRNITRHRTRTKSN